VPALRILLTNDDGWDAPGLAALKSAASEFGDVRVLAPFAQHSYAGHRVTTDVTLRIEEIAPNEFHLTGTPADCVRVALTTVFPDTDLVLSGINRGGNLGADLYTSGTVAAAREAALLGCPGIAVSQYIRRGMELDWRCSGRRAREVLRQLLAEAREPKTYWNVNLPHVEDGLRADFVHCDPDNQPLDIRYHREGEEVRYAGSYPDRPRTPGLDVDRCFAGSITISKLKL
jgi:5'-nucleotidase